MANNTNWTYLAVALIAGLVIGGFTLGPFFVFCPPTGDLYPEDSTWRTGTLTISGSTTVLPIAEGCAVEFMNMHSGVSITVSGGGSGTGASDLIDELNDIGDMSRDPRSYEYDAAAAAGVDIVKHAVALDGIAIIVNPTVASSLELDFETIANIFAGTYATWNEVDAALPNQEIVVFDRDAASGTRGTFIELVMDDFELEITTAASVQPGNPAVRQSVEDTDYSVGYIGLGFITGNIVAVSVMEEAGGTAYAPTSENVESLVYPISRYLWMVTDGIPESGSLIDRFLDYVKGPTGQDIAVDEGFVALYPTS